MMQNSRKIAVIGAGRWGRNIIRTLHELGVLAAVAEPNEALCQDLSQAYPGIKIYADYHTLLAQSAIKAVAIATPVKTHYQVAHDALSADKDVFVEKPMTVNASEGQDLVKLARARNKILMAGHMLLYQPAIRQIKTFLDEGRLGRVYSFRQVRRNLGTIRTHENALYSLGVHDLAVLSYLVGEPAASIDFAHQEITTPGVADDVTAHMCYPSGVQAHLHVTWLWPVKDRQLMILGERGALHYDELQHQVTWHHAHGNADATVTNEGAEVVFQGDSQPLRLEMEHFLSCIASRQQPLSSGEQGVEVVRMMSQMREANQPINGEYSLLHKG